MSVAALVVKIGGSLAASPLLGAWLTAIATARGRLVVVPGGGPFADTVRAVQPVLGFDDTTAHAMALLAMAQYGIFLASHRDAVLTPAETLQAVAATLAAGGMPVWLPPHTLGAADGVAASWDMTSDSLALWLASRLGAPALLLVKSKSEGTDLLDGAFAGLRPGYAGRVFLAGPAHLPRGSIDPRHPPGVLLP